MKGSPFCFISKYFITQLASGSYTTDNYVSYNKI
jgi:hypothetical protein